MKISKETFRKLVPTLDIITYQHAVGVAVGRIYFQVEDLDTSDWLKVGIWEALWSEGFQRDTIKTVLKMLTDAIELVAPKLDAEAAADACGKFAETPVLVVTVSDRKYATWTGWDRWLVLDAGVEATTDALAEPAVKHLSVDVAALDHRLRRWMAKLGGKDAGHRHHAGADPG